MRLPFYKKKIIVYFYPALLIALCLASYYHSLGGVFVFDDTVAIVKNQDVIRSHTDLAEIFSHDFWGANLSDPDSHKSYRPLTILMFHLEYNFFNLKSYHMKFVNLVLHCINSCLVFRLIVNLAQSQQSHKNLAFIASALFAVHPIHTEAVCGVVGRAELMFCLCYLLSLLVIDTMASRKTEDIKGREIARLICIIAISVIGILFKETAITILPACVFYDFVKRRHYKRSFQTQLKYIFRRRNGVFICLTALVLNFRLWIQNFESPKFKPMDNPIAASEDLLTSLLSQNFLYVLNSWILLCPQWLSFDWALGCVRLVQSFADIRMLGVLLLYVCVFKIITRGNIMLIGFGLVVIPFLPASGILRVGFVIAERVLYVPSIGICLIVAHSFTELLEKCSENWKKPIYAALVLLLMCFLLRTRQRAAEWMTEEKLFSSALNVCPQNAKVHYNIARLATDKGDRKKAFQYYHHAIKLYPEYEAALMNLGNLYREIGDLVTAEKFIQNALEVLPEFPAAWMNLGIVQASRKHYSEAISSYQKALHYRKHYPVCYYNMGNLFLEIKQFSEAFKHWQEAVALKPHQPKAWANILTMLDSRGLYEDAIRLSERALHYLPNDTAILFIRANVYGKMKHYIEAEELYKRVIKMEPLNVMYHTNLGVLYHRWDKLNFAINSYKTAIQLNPKAAKTATDNLGKLLSRTNSHRDELLT